MSAEEDDPPQRSAHSLTSDEESETASASSKERPRKKIKLAAGHKRVGSATTSGKQRHRQQRYCCKWEENSEFKGWLSPVANNPLKAKCKICHSEFIAELTVIKRHGAGTGHQSKVKDLGHRKVRQMSLLECQGAIKGLSDFEKQVAEAEIRTTGFLAECNISLRTAGPLVKRDKATYPDSKIAQAVSLERTKATSIAKYVIGDVHFKDLTERLKKEKFSVLIDESTDQGSVKTMAIMVRLPSEKDKKVRDFFWRVVQVFTDADGAVTGATAEHLFKLLKKSFEDVDVPLENIIGFGSDNCNVMLGAHNSVAQRLRVLLPGIVIQGCICHSLHICASESCKELPKTAEELGRNIYNYFRNSSKRQIMLTEFQEFCDVEIHKILKPSQTRWLSLVSVVRRILEQWNPLKLFFTAKKLENDKDDTSVDQIVDLMLDPEIKLYYLFLDWVLPKITELNELFQSESSLVTSVHSKMCATYKELLRTYIDPKYVDHTSLHLIDPVTGPTNQASFIPLANMYLGVKVMKELQKPEYSQSPSLVLKFRALCRNFLSKLCSELRKRFDFSPTSPFAYMAALSPKEALSTAITRTETLVMLAEVVPRILPEDDLDRLQAIDTQWRNLPSTKFDDLPKEPDQFWYAIRESTNVPGEQTFKDLAEFAIQVLSLPHSSACCERLFSKVNLIKTKTRNRLVSDTINGLISTSECCKEGGGSAIFPVTSEMVSLMTAKNLYPWKYRPKEATNTDGSGNNCEDEPEILFEEL